MFKINLVIILVTFAYLTSSQSCSKNCVKCSNFPDCQQCSAGYFLVNNRQCRPCPRNCKTCTLHENLHPVCTDCSDPSSSSSNCIECVPSCQECSGTPDNCTLCKSGFTLKVNGDSSKSHCVEDKNCNQISHCLSCASNDTQNQICETCEKNYFSFRRGCEKCKEPCQECQIDLQTLWTETVQPFWNQSLIQLKKMVEEKTNSSKRLLQEQENDNNNKNDFSQNYVNWTLTQWNSANWTKFELADYQNMTVTEVKGWTEAYFFFKAAETKLIENTTLISLMYNCLPIVEELLNLTEKNRNQWKHLARFLSTYSASRWKGNQLDRMIVQLATDRTACLSCPIGFQLNGPVDTPSGQCLRCNDNCLYCSNQNCLECDRGFYLSTSGACQLCQHPCEYCSGSSTNCTTCTFPFILSEGTCVTCEYPCLQCSPTNSSECLTCDQPYSLYPNSTQGCFECSDSNCSYCNETNTEDCYECKFGFVAINGSCKACQDNCYYCNYENQTHICFSCKEGFALMDGVCMECSKNCSNCFGEDVETCKDCEFGKFVNTTSGECTKCPKGCLDCSSNDTCLEYEDGIVIYEDEIVFCQYGCITCNSSNPSQCLNCQDGYYLSNDICMLCASNCQKCDNQTYCTQCRRNGKLSGGECISCSKNCRQCDPENMTQCISCPRGLILSNGSCISSGCESGCISCNQTNTSQCKICEKGFGLKSNGKCIRCVGKCTGKCNPENINECQSCMEGFYLQSGSCIRCPQGCSICTSNTTCTTCYSGYTFNKTASSCTKQCLFPCSQCASTACDSCAKGYVKENSKCVVDTSCNPECTTCLSGSQQNSTTFECIRCPSDCATCQNGVCSQCFDGYYIDGSNNCVACSEKCFTCYDNETCILCAAGYTKEILSAETTFSSIVFGDNCIACSSNCKTCSIYKNRCTSCRDGFRLKGQKCVGRYTVVYKYELDYDFDKFLQNSQSQNFTKHMSHKFNNDAERNTIKSLRKGSTIVQGEVSADSSTQASEIQQQLSATNSLGEYKVLASSVSVAYNDQPVSESYTGTPQEFKKTGIVVGSVVGGILLVFIIVTIVCCCRRNTGTKYTEESNNMESRNKSGNYQQARHPTTSDNLKGGNNDVI